MRTIAWTSLVLPAVLGACGGGGGGGSPPPAGPEVRLALADATLPAGVPEVSLHVSLDDFAAGTHPVLLQADLVIDPPLVAPTTTGTALVPRQNQVTLELAAASGHVRVLCGDGRNRVAATLARGPLFDVVLAARSPRTVGTARLELRNIVVVDEAGVRLAVDPNPVAASVVVE